MASPTSRKTPDMCMHCGKALRSSSNSENYHKKCYKIVKKEAYKNRGTCTVCNKRRVIDTYVHECEHCMNARMSNEQDMLIEEWWKGSNSASTFPWW